MCGIVGVVGPGAADPALVRSLAECLVHRGPDGGDVWTAQERDGVEVGLGHRRLAVLGLGDVGQQPMHSVSGRYVVTYNGELYNHVALRERLQHEGRAPQWRGSSDTETLLAAIEAWGLEATLPELVGMFALAVWDRTAGELSLARDRLGEKPLTWTLQDGALWFASQPVALHRSPRVRADVDPDALAALLRYGAIHGGASLFRGHDRVGPGTLLQFRPGHDDRPRTSVWWSFDGIARDGTARHDDAKMDAAAAVTAVGAALDTSVRGQLLSDVPLGAFLSGGIDSSLVVASMRRVSETPVRTFTIGFRETSHDESRHAREIAAVLGTEHHELLLTDADAAALVPDLPHVYDEPFADSSQLPTLLVSRFARQHVTVALSGDGGDELFAGYLRYRDLERLAAVPRVVAAGAFVVHGALGIVTRDTTRRDLALDVLRGEASVVRRLLSANPRAERLVVGVDARAAERTHAAAWRATSGLGSRTERAMAFDTTRYLVDDILQKVDRAAMSVGLETRLPLLDHRLVELAWRLPSEVRLRDGGKWVLRELLARDVPRALFERPKRGFSVPIGQWLRGALRPWAEELLSRRALEDHGLLDAPQVRELWAAHARGRRELGSALWPVLMFQAWHAARARH